MAPSFHMRLHASRSLSPARVVLATLRFWIGQAGARLPGACALCSATGPHVLCGGCRADFFGAGVPRCSCCALPLASAQSSGPVCGRCVQRPPAFDATVTAADYAAPLDQLVLGLKFGARLALAPLFAQQLRAAMSDRQIHLGACASGDGLPDFLAPVPLGHARLQERGFNQSLEIARSLSSAVGVPLLPRLLIRVRDTPPQARLAPLARRQNLLDAFALAPQTAGRIRGRHVGVVDDVMTTGATLNEIATTLKHSGAARVTNLVFARTPLP